MADLHETQGAAPQRLSFGPFVLDKSQRRLSRDGNAIRLTAKPFDVLAFFVENAGQVVTRDHLRSAVWDGASVSDAAVEQAITKVRKAIGDDLANPTYIHTLWGKGYTFVADVTPVPLSKDLGRNPAPTPTAQELSVDADASESGATSGSRKASGLRKHLGHVSFVCTAYAALFALGVIVEIAYDYGRYGLASLYAAAVAWIWMCGTTGTCFYASSPAALRGNGGRNVAIGILAASVGLLVAATHGILPTTTVTLLSYQGHTASAAYLKNVIYFYALGVTFIMLPYHVVITIEERAVNAVPADAPFPKPGLLFGLLIGAGIWSLLSVARIFEHLRPGPYMSLYMSLLQIERLLGFAVATECLIWYHLAIVRYRQASRRRDQPNP
jgi:DNA-binding winged helix-turn-helix (wHTH) protein